MEFTSLAQLSTLDGSAVRKILISSLEFSADEFSRILAVAPKLEAIELKGILYRYNHFFAKKLPVLKHLKILYVKRCEEGVLQHFKRAPINELFIDFPKATNFFDENPDNHDVSHEFLLCARKLKTFSVVNPQQIFKRDISDQVKFQLVDFFVKSETEFSQRNYKNLSKFLSKQKELKYLIVENVLDFKLLKQIGMELELERLEICSSFEFPNITDDEWSQLKENYSVSNLVLDFNGKTTSSSDSCVSKVLSLFQNVNMLILRNVVLSEKDMRMIADMEYLKKISFIECQIKYICGMPLFLKAIVFENIARDSIVNLMGYNIHVDELSILRK